MLHAPFLFPYTVKTFFKKEFSMYNKYAIRLMRVMDLDLNIRFIGETGVEVIPRTKPHLGRIEHYADNHGSKLIALMKAIDLAAEDMREAQ